jgi:hypothetical protein
LKVLKESVFWESSRRELDRRAACRAARDGGTAAGVVAGSWMSFVFFRCMRGATHRTRRRGIITLIPKEEEPPQHRWRGRGVRCQGVVYQTSYHSAVANARTGFASSIDLASLTRVQSPTWKRKSNLRAVAVAAAAAAVAARQANR